MKIIKGIIPEPQKVVIYGPQGIGKSSLAALFPRPLFLDTEKGSRRLNLDRVEINSLAEFSAAISKVADFQEYGTIVIDTIDWLEAKMKEKIVTQYSAKDRAYDREGSFIGDEMMKALSSLDVFISAGKHVVLLAHSATVKIDLPDQQASFDRYELDMNKKHVAPIVKHWCDHLLFMRYKLRVREVDDGKNKGLGGEIRLLCTSTKAAYDAKNRSKNPDLHGEFECKTSEDGIALIQRIFASVNAPWHTESISTASHGAQGEPATGSVQPQKQETLKPLSAASRGQEASLSTGVQLSGAEPTINLSPPTPEEDQIPMGVRPLVELIGENETAVNAYLVGRAVIQDGQTFRDASAAFIERVKKNPSGFMAQALKGVAS